MYGYNPKRTTKPLQRTTKRKVLSVINEKGAYIRVSYKSLDFYKKECGAIYEKAVSDHRIEYFNDEDICVMIYEF